MYHGSHLFDLYILTIFSLQPCDQPCASSHCCLDTRSLSADKLLQDEKFAFAKTLQLYPQGGFSPPEGPWTKLSTLWQVVNFAYGASREKGQQQMSGPHGFQLDCSQCDICMIHCVLCSKMFLREKKCYMFLL